MPSRGCPLDRRVPAVTSAGARPARLGAGRLARATAQPPPDCPWCRLETGTVTRAMRRRSSCLVVLSLCAVTLLMPPVGTAGPRAHLTRSCTPYTAHLVSVQFGHRWVFKVRIHDLVVHRTRCGSGVRSVIARFDRWLARGNWQVGRYYPFGAWRCRAFRPYGNPAVHQSNCQHAGGRTISWTETQVSARRVT